MIEEIIFLEKDRKVTVDFVYQKFLERTRYDVEVSASTIYRYMKKGMDLRFKLPPKLKECCNSYDNKIFR